jgi:uncharacterized protein (TIGR00369 family)
MSTTSVSPDADTSGEATSKKGRRGIARFAGLVSPAELAKRFLPSAEARGNFIRDAWDKLEKVPGGKRIFSALVGLVAPYTGTINAQVVDLAPGRSRVTMEDRRGLRNHLRSVHAIALVNLAELTGNVALAYSLPDDGRFIVAGLSIDYLKKARGTLTATCACPVPTTSARAELDVPVEIHDAQGDLVARATLRSLVGPKK